MSVYQHFGADASAGAFYVLANGEQSDLTTQHMIGVAAATNFLLGHPFGEVDARKHWEKLNNDAGTWLTQSRE